MTESNITDSNKGEAAEENTSISTSQPAGNPELTADGQTIETAPTETDYEAALDAASFTLSSYDSDPQPDVAWEDDEEPMLAAPVKVEQEDVDLSDLSDLRALARRLRPSEGVELELQADDEEDDLLDSQDGVWSDPYLSSSRTHAEPASDDGFDIEDIDSQTRGLRSNAFEADLEDEDAFEDTLIVPSPEEVLAHVGMAKANGADDPYHLADDLDDEFDAELDLHDANVFTAAQKRADAINKGLDFGDPDLGRGRDKAQLKASRVGVDYASLTEEPSFYAASKSGSEDHPFYRPLTADSGRLNAARRAAERLEPKSDDAKSAGILSKMFGKRRQESDFDHGSAQLSEPAFNKPVHQTRPEYQDDDGYQNDGGRTGMPGFGAKMASMNLIAQSSRVMAGTAAAGVIALAGIGVWSWQNNSSEIRTISVDTSFEKVIPEVAGGMVVPHRDMGILNGDQALTSAPTTDMIQALDQLEPLSLPDLKAQMEASATQHETNIDSLISSFEEVAAPLKALKPEQAASAANEPLVMPELSPPAAVEVVDPLEALILNPDDFEGDDIMQLLLKETSAVGTDGVDADLAPSPATAHGSLTSAAAAFLFQSNWQAAMPSVDDIWEYPEIGSTPGKSSKGSSKLKASAAHIDDRSILAPKLTSVDFLDVPAEVQAEGVEVAQLLSDGAGGVRLAPEIMLAGGIDDQPQADLSAQGVPDGPWIPPLLPQDATQPVALQLASMGSPNSARRQYQKYARRYSDLLGDMVLSVQTKNIGMKRFYRVQVGPFPNELTALDMCGMLKARGHRSCFVPKR